MATLITMLFTLVVCLEILYLSVPFLRNLIEDYSQRNDKLERVYNVAFRDARKAQERANTTQTGTSPLVIYLGLKIKQFIVVAIAFYIATNLDLFINLVLNIVGPVVDYIKVLLHTR